MRNLQQIGSRLLGRNTFFDLSLSVTFQ